MTAADRAGLSATGAVEVKVMQLFNSVRISPLNPAVRANGTIQFTAVAGDQFDQPLADQPPLVWTVSGGGEFTKAGSFTAGTTPGEYSVRVYSTRFGKVTGSGKINVTPANPVHQR